MDEQSLLRHKAAVFDRNDTVIIGAGPAGLTAAYEISNRGRYAIVLERDPDYVGGISRTVCYKGFHFDIGGHRFFSKNPEVERLWSDILGPRMIERARLSRIYYRGRFFKYPLEAIDVLRNLGVYESAACVASYLAARLRPQKEPRSFEEWVTNAFGRRLYRIFFESYTEKVWGLRCRDISADWAAQRIRDLSMKTLIRRALSMKKRGPVVKTLIDRFRYPLKGPGEMWQRFAALLNARGIRIQMGEPVTGIEWGSEGVRAVTSTGAQGIRRYPGRHFISTMPIRELVAALNPAPPEQIIRAAASLRYRDFLTVALIIDQAELFPDQWIYIHEPQVRVGRVQNFKNWSPAMVPDPRYTVLGLEYFCFDSDPLWNSPDDELLAIGAREMASLGLVEPRRVVDGTVVRQRAAYPVYDGNYREAVATIRQFISRELPNLQLAGRNGMHKYNNQDHAMMTGMMAAWNTMGDSYDQWRVNADALYLEEDTGAEPADARMVPRRLAGSVAL